MKKDNEQTFKDALQDMVKSFRLKNKLQQKSIESVWEKLMGQSIARYTTNIRLRKKKLSITIDSAPLRQELSFGKEKIKNLINEELGEEAVEVVVIY